MKTQDLFKTKASKVNESIHKAFGKKIDFSTFDAPKLEDARNKLRTQLSQIRNESGFNENLENDTFHQAQWMLDAINAELAEREEKAIDSLEITDTPVEGEAMDKVTEGEVQQASAIVTAKTMVDRLSRFIEEVSSMENETLLQLGDSIRDEIGQAESKTFIETSAPAIQTALEALKTSRESLSSAVGVLAGEEAAGEMLGAEPEEGGATDMAEPAADAGAEAPAEAPADDFATAEPAAGGMETAGREQRESIDYESRLLKTLAG